MRSDERQLLSLLAYVFLRHGQNDKALKLLRAGGRLASNDAEIQKTLAYAELVCGHAGEALAAINNYVRLSGDGDVASPAQIIRARALLQLDRQAEARDCFRRFVEAHAAVATGGDEQPTRTRRGAASGRPAAAGGR